MGELGVLIEQGPSDWQLLQRPAVLDIGGRWVAGEQTGVVEICVVDELSQRVVVQWHEAATSDGTWHASVPLPDGGPYRVETRFRADTVAATPEWSIRGDMRHHIGAGDVWIIAGQSNSAGYGRGPVHDPPELGIHLFANDNTWKLATHPLNDSTGTVHEANREFANPGHAPWLHFARLLRERLGVPIGLVQTALGGSPLVAWERGGILFDTMVEAVRASGTPATGILWYQGESDTGYPEPSTTYLERFGGAVEAWREALGDVEVVTVQLNRVYPGESDASVHDGWTTVRDAQRCAAAEIDGVYVVPSLDLPLCDLIHTSAAGNLVIAERAAEAVLDGARAPEIVRAKSSRDGIQLEFSSVTERIGNVDLAAQPFKVVDEDGDVDVAAVTYPGGPAVELVLGRPLRGAATVHGGWGHDPDTMPMDVARQLPVLAFSIAVGDDAGDCY